MKQYKTKKRQNGTMGKKDKTVQRQKKDKLVQNLFFSVVFPKLPQQRVCDIPQLLEQTATYPY